MTPYPQVQQLIERWITGRDVTVRDLINLNRDEREAFYSWLSPANETRLRIAVTNFLQSRKG